MTQSRTPRHCQAPRRPGGPGVSGEPESYCASESAAGLVTVTGGHGEAHRDSNGHRPTVATVAVPVTTTHAAWAWQPGLLILVITGTD